MGKVIMCNGFGCVMAIRKLQIIGGESAGITLPKETLRDIGVIVDGELAERYVHIEHVEHDGKGERFTVEIIG